MFKKNLLVSIILIFNITFVNAIDFLEVDVEYGKYLINKPDREGQEFTDKLESYNDYRIKSNQKVSQTCESKGGCIIDNNGNGVFDSNELYSQFKEADLNSSNTNTSANSISNSNSNSSDTQKDITKQVNQSDVDKANQDYIDAQNDYVDAEYAADDARESKQNAESDLIEALSDQIDAEDSYEKAVDEFNKAVYDSGGNITDPDVLAAQEKLNDAEKELDDINKDVEAAEEKKELTKKTSEKADLVLKEKGDIAEKAEDKADAVASEAASNSAGGKSPIRRLGNETIKNSLIGISENEVLPEEDDGLNLLESIFIWIKDSLTGLLLVIAVGAFLFIGIRLGLARGNPEEFKKGIMQLIYAIVGIFIVAFAWAAVTLVAGLNL